MNQLNSGLFYYNSGLVDFFFGIRIIKPHPVDLLVGGLEGKNGFYIF